MPLLLLDESPRHPDVNDLLPLEEPRLSSTAFLKTGASLLAADANNLINNFVLLGLLNWIAAGSETQTTKNLAMVTTLNLVLYFSLSFTYIGYVSGPDIVKSYLTLKKQNSDLSHAKQNIADFYSNLIRLSCCVSMIGIPCLYFSETLLQSCGYSEEVASAVGRILRPFSPIVLIRTLQIPAESLVIGFQFQPAMSLESVNLTLAIVLATWVGKSLNSIEAAFGFLMMEAAFACLLYNACVFFHPAFTDLQLFQHAKKRFLSTTATLPAIHPSIQFTALLKDSVALAMAVMADVCFAFYASHLASRLGETSSATLGVLSPLNTFMSVAVVNFAYASRVHMASDPQLYRMASHSLAIICGLALILPIAIAILPMLLLKLFQHEQDDVATLLPTAARLYVPITAFDVIRIVLSIHLKRGSQNMWRTAFSNLTGAVIGGLAAAELSAQPTLGLYGILLGNLIFVLTDACILTPLWIQNMKHPPPSRMPAAPPIPPTHYPPMLQQPAQKTLEIPTPQLTIATL